MTNKTSEIMFLIETQIIEREWDTIEEKNVIAVYQQFKPSSKMLQCYTMKEKHSHGSIAYFKSLPLASRNEYKPLLEHMQKEFPDTRFNVNNNPFYFYF